jgi:hypothetical protein
MKVERISEEDVTILTTNPLAVVYKGKKYISFRDSRYVSYSDIRGEFFEVEFSKHPQGDDFAHLTTFCED